MRPVAKTTPIASWRDVIVPPAASINSIPPSGMALSSSNSTTAPPEGVDSLTLNAGESDVRTGEVEGSVHAAANTTASRVASGTAPRPARSPGQTLGVQTAITTSGKGKRITVRLACATGGPARRSEGSGGRTRGPVPPHRASCGHVRTGLHALARRRSRRRSDAFGIGGRCRPKTVRVGGLRTKTQRRAPAPRCLTTRPSPPSRCRSPLRPAPRRRGRNACSASGTCGRWCPGGSARSG